MCVRDFDIYKIYICDFNKYLHIYIYNIYFDVHIKIYIDIYQNIYFDFDIHKIYVYILIYTYTVIKPTLRHCRIHRILNFLHLNEIYESRS